MKLKAAAVGAASLLCAVLASSGARAADFYVVAFHGDPDDQSVELLDPSSIVATAGGAKKAHLADVSAMDLWDDDWIEFNCPAGTFRYVSSLAHLAGDDTLDRADIVKAGEWQTSDAGTLAAKAAEAVCNWSPSLLTDHTRLSADSFEALIHRASRVLTNAGGSGK